MSFELTVPQLGESITEVEIGDWLKAQGDRVEKDEPVVALESAKATVELPAPEAGTISRVLKQKGQVAHIGEAIAYIETDGQAKAPGKSPEQETKEKPSAPPRPKATPPKSETKSDTPSAKSNSGPGEAEQAAKSVPEPKKAP